MKFKKNHIHLFFFTVELHGSLYGDVICFCLFIIFSWSKKLPILKEDQRGSFTIVGTVPVIKNENIFFIFHKRRMDDF